MIQFRVVQPYIHARTEQTGQRHVVIGEIGHRQLPAHRMNAMDHLLAGLILRMRLAGKDELDRPRFFHQPPQPFDIVKDQRATFVGGGAAGEAEGEHIAIESRIGLSIHVIHQRQFGFTVRGPIRQVGTESVALFL